jgi:tRNA-dihydrouridine synthase 1
MMGSVSDVQGEKVVGEAQSVVNAAGTGQRKRVKLHGRAFYESIGSPKLVLAPMVEQSEFVRLLFAL